MSKNTRKPLWKVYSLKRPYRTNRYGHTHDRWAVDRFEDGEYVTKLDSDYSKEEAKEAVRQAASSGEQIRIEDMDGNELRVEEVKQE
jgi:membrane protein implicated in regulation of membrane protease activity